MSHLSCHLLHVKLAERQSQIRRSEVELREAFIKPLMYESRKRAFVMSIYCCEIEISFERNLQLQ